MTQRYLATLQFETTKDYDHNLTLLLSLIEQTPEDSIVLAPEVCLTDFDYEHFDEAASFYDKAVNTLLPLSDQRIICLTLIHKDKQGAFLNVALVFHGKRIVHQQTKNKLFRLGDEHEYFTQGPDEKLYPFKIDGITFGVLICFELRFKQYWQDLEGADIILVPARWGKLRSDNFKVLTQALAVINQCYVLASDASNEECTAQSGIISPFGEAEYNGNNSCLLLPYDKQEIRRMRRYLNVGIR